MDAMEKTANMARSLTTRLNNRKKSITEGTAMGRAFTVKKSGDKTPYYRPEISLPVELLSATNPLAFTAPDLPHINSDSILTPDIRHLTSHSSSASLRSESSVPPLSSATSTVFTSGLTTPTDEVPEKHMEDLQTRLAEADKATTSGPLSPQSQAPGTPQTPASETAPVTTPPSPSAAAPAVPKRAPSHTKKSHQALARHRSMSRARSESTAPAAGDGDSRKSSSSSRHPSMHSSKDGMRNSTDMFSARSPAPASATVDPDHPFSAELAKLTEVAEEFAPTRGRAEEQTARPRASSPGSSRSRSRPAMPQTPKTPKTPAPVRSTMRKQKPIIEPTVWDEEEEYLSKHGLHMFSAEDYIAEIGSPYIASFPGVIH